MTQQPDDWHEPGEDVPPPDESNWLEPEGELYHFYPPSASNEDHVPRGTIAKLFAAMLLCVLAGAVASAGLELRQQTLVGWLLVVAGALLVIPAVRIGIRSLVKLLVVFNQLNRRDSE